MSSPAPFVDVCGFPAPGEAVHPTVRAAEHLKAAGWTPPNEQRCPGCDGSGYAPPVMNFDGSEDGPYPCDRCHGEGIAA